jgi:hypothetical protein
MKRLAGSASADNQHSCISELSGSKIERSSKSRSKVWYNQPFNKEWLKDSNVKDWIESDPNDRYIVRCKFCDVKLCNANKSALLTHSSSQKHRKHSEINKNSTKISSFFVLPEEHSLKDQVARAELLLTAFAAEHHLPFHQADHLTGTLKKMFPDSQIAKSMTMKRTKLSYVLQDGIAREEKDEITKICQSNKFSVIIDESTDVSVCQILAIVVRYYDKNETRVVDALLDSIEVQDATGEGLFRSFEILLDKRNIPISNIIGFASDNCSTMMGRHSGFQAFLKQKVPSVFILGCICHSFALCANHASSCLPYWLESFVKSVCCYFARSSKRQHAFQLIQDAVKAPNHRILKLAQTRWLSRGQVISRILQQWDALILFFETEATTDKVDGAGDLHKFMLAAGTKHILLFVNYVIAKVDKMNVEFQSEYFRIHKVFDSVSDEYRNLMAMFIKHEVMQECELADIDPLNGNLHKKLEKIDVGGRCENFLRQKSLGDNEMQFRRDALSFLSDLCAQIRQRFPLTSDSVLAHMRVIDVKTALMHEKRMESIIPLASFFPKLVSEIELDNLQDQWKSLAVSKQSLGEMVKLEPAIFWFNLRLIKDGNDHSKFGLLSSFMCEIMALPISSACVERIFSQINMIKTTQTNKLHAATVSNRLLAKQAIKRQGVVCHSWNPSISLLSDVAEGRCRKRYMDRVHKTKSSHVLHSEVRSKYEEEEEDVYDCIDFSDN